jgi:alpha-ketoglutarate-dependent taurine dioxygenase
LSLSSSPGLWSASDVDLESCSVALDNELDTDEVCSQVTQHVLDGRGFVVLRSSPSLPLDDARDRLIAIATAIGVTKPQNAQGEHMTALADTPDKTDWLTPQPFHTDAGDLLLLYCIQPAHQGGRTRLASAAAAYARLQEQFPDAARLLLEPWHFDRKGRPGPPTFTRAIIEHRHDDLLSCFYLPGTLRITLQDPSDPEIARRLKTLAAFDEALEHHESNISLMLAPGDCLIVNNSRVLHARTSYIDGPKPRLLLRCWVDVSSQLR